MNEEHGPHDQGHDTAPPTPQPPAPAAGGMDPSFEEAQSKKILCGIMGILFGSLGVHKFILGQTTPAIIMLACTLGGYVLSFLCIPILLPAAMSIIGIIEGIIYLTKTTPEFKRIYMDEGKAWF